VCVRAYALGYTRTVFRHYRPTWAATVRRALRPLIVFIIVYIMTFGVYANMYMFYLMTWRMLAAGLLLPW
jgi:sodium/bile acid cotransporter 3/5